MVPLIRKEKMQKKPSPHLGQNRKKGPESPVEKKIIFDPLFFNTEDFDHVDYIQKNAEKYFEDSPSRAIKLFEKAAGLAPANEKLYLRQASFLMSYGREKRIKKYLLLASKKFKTALRISPNNFDSLCDWADCLFFAGTSWNDTHLLYEAKKKLDLALQLKNGASDRKMAELYRKYGNLMRCIYNTSKELYDLHQALTGFGKGASLVDGITGAYWEDFAETALLMAEQTKDLRFFHKAIQCIKNAVSQDSSCASYWISFGTILTKMYGITFDEDHFTQANECFVNAVKLAPETTDAWRLWAELLFSSGSHLGDTKKLISALEKCKKARLFDKRSRELLVLWTRILIDLGLIVEKHQWFYEAENILSELKKIAPQSDMVFELTGRLFAAKGKYYNDLDLYYQAIEAWQEGLSINRTSHVLWYLIGSTYVITSNLDADPVIPERAAHFLTKAIRLFTDPNYYYAYAELLSMIAEEKGDRETLENAILHYEQAFALEKNLVAPRTDRLADFARALDLLGDLTHDTNHYIRACECLKKALVLHPQNTSLHHKMACVLTHLGEHTDEREIYYHALSYFKLAQRSDPENGIVALDYGLALISLSEILPPSDECQDLIKEAEYKLVQSIKLGNIEAYYHLGCLYSIMKQFDKAVHMLEKSIRFRSIPPLEEVLEDEWLDNLRMSEYFEQLIQTIESSQKSD